MENEIEEKAKETASDGLPNEETKTEDTNNQTNVETLIIDIKHQYEDKINTIVKSKNDEIRARDDIIKQLLNNDTKMTAKATIADRINEKRNFKKW